MGTIRCCKSRENARTIGGVLEQERSGQGRVRVKEQKEKEIKSKEISKVK